MARKRQREDRQFESDEAGRGMPDGKDAAPAREKLRVDGEIKKRENKYYRKLSERYKVAGFVFFLVFVVFCGVMMLRYSEYITYDNFVYLIRDFDSMDSAKVNAADEIILEIDSSSAVRPFKDGFAVAANDGVTIYDSTGVVLISESERFSYPALAVSDKYIIAYDIGGSSYSVYNGITRIVTRKTDFPIVCASVCDNGSFIITTESDEAKYVIEVYNTALQNTMNIFKDKYVAAAAVSSDGQWVATASLGESGADFACEVSFYKVGDSEASKTVSYSMAFPLILEGLDGGNFVLLCDDAVRFFSSSGELLSETAAVGNGVSRFDAEKNGVILVCRENSMGTSSRVYTFDAEGNIIYNSSVDMRVDSAYISSADSTYAGYLVDGDNVVCLKDTGNETYSFEDDIQCVIETGSGAYGYLGGRAVRIGKKD